MTWRGHTRVETLLGDDSLVAVDADSVYFTVHDRYRSFSNNTLCAEILAFRSPAAPSGRS